MRTPIFTRTLPRLHGPGHAFRSSLFSLRKLSSRAPREHTRQESSVASPYARNCERTYETRPFAVERVGGRECHISWSDGRSGIRKEWRDTASPEATEGNVAVSGRNSVTGRIFSWLRQMFLPTNYPQSVHSSYASFHILQALETTMATITSVLCNQALLTSVGMSAEGSVFGAVAVQWIIKDGAGEVAKLFFIRHFSTYFDSHPKTFTLFGEVLGCLGSGLQIATVLIAPSPLNFLLCAAGGNIFKLVGNAIWSTTHIKFIRYFSMQGNDGDVAAKDESQASVAQLAGYAAGISLLTFSHAPAYLYAIFFAAVPLHLTMTAYMMRVATFELLTLPRISHLAQTYVNDGVVGSQKDLDREHATGLFGEFYKNNGDRWLTLAPRVGDALNTSSDVDRSTWQVCSQVFQDDRYLLLPCDSPRGPLISVLFHPDATTDDMLQSILHAASVRSLLSRDASCPTPSLRTVLSETRVQAQQDFSAFKQALHERGWRTDELCFADLGHRVIWTA
ncbi:vitamin B6 photo-protection and homoeostasis-domain-containing protein [Dichomitus squalens]|uniref:Vitamin B6 photo-protection and homoeostasis-domain-containing protein n=1 Tax=Dichomitus squalens TaxID=114155 RepID=A0A4Q9MZ96_9APHY|nr:vitamin B6 photo-protection and homoeostasis-domain-containing protein [Dichomitus squalens]